METISIDVQLDTTNNLHKEVLHKIHSSPPQQEAYTTMFVTGYHILKVIHTLDKGMVHDWQGISHGQTAESLRLRGEIDSIQAEYEKRLQLAEEGRNRAIQRYSDLEAEIERRIKSALCDNQIQRDPLLSCGTALVITFVSKLLLCTPIFSAGVHSKMQARQKALLRAFCTPQGSMFCRYVVTNEHPVEWEIEPMAIEYITGDMLRLECSKRHWAQFYSKWRRWLHQQFPYVPLGCRDWRGMFLRYCLVEFPEILLFIQERLGLSHMVFDNWPNSSTNNSTKNILHELYEYFRLT